MRGFFILCFVSLVSLLIVSFEKTEVVRATVPPILNNITISSSTGGQYISNFNLIEDSTANIYMHGSFTDGDGCSDISQNGKIEAVLYRSSVADAEKCLPNNNRCYHGAFSTGECTVTGCDSGEEIVAYYECAIPIEYYADATDAGEYVDDNWIGYVEITDGSQATSSLQNSFEMNSLAAMAFNGNLNYGIMSLGATSSKQTIQIRNVGNVAIDATLSGTDMQCSSGIIPIASQHYSLVSTSTYEEALPLGILGTVAEINLPKFTGSSQLANVYFQIKMATSSVSGICSGNNILGAIADN